MSSHHIKDFVLDVNDWSYRDEGGANVVLAYAGADPELVWIVNTYSRYVHISRNAERSMC